MALQRLISMSILSKQEQHSMIGSESPWTLLKRDIRVVKAVMTESGRQC